ncbi:MAG: DUF4349 domain-containing protein [Actinomycetales bacterium]|nr:DUF4349 domain-containing protein [Actinomycetales bacterium]
MKRSLVSLAAAGVVALTGTGFLSGCGNNGPTPAFEDAPYSDEMAAEAPELASEMSMDAAGADSQADQQIIRTAYVSVDVDDVATGVSAIADLTADLEGQLQSQSVQGTGEDSSANMNVRVPASNLDALLASIDTLGEVTSSSVDAQDVAVEVIDLEARITTLEESINRLRDLQSQAASVADLVTVESELSARQAELESLTARRDYLMRQVEMSTAYISLTSATTGPRVTPDFLGGLERGWNSLISLAAGLITLGGFLTPYLLIAGAITAIVLIIFALSRRDRKEK